MADLLYNFLDNNFTIYDSVENPKITIPSLLNDTGYDDISDWAMNVSLSGTPIVKNNVTSSEIINNNNPETQIMNNTLTQHLDKKQYAKLFFINKIKENNADMTDDKADYISAGIVGNLLVESDLNTTAKGDGGNAIGIAQWHPDRLRGLKKLAEQRGTDIMDLDTLLEYVWKELNSTEKRALTLLLNTTNVEEAAESFMKNFERPNRNPKINGLERRIKYARSLYKQS